MNAGNPSTLHITVQSKVGQSTVRLDYKAFIKQHFLHYGDIIGYDNTCMSLPALNSSMHIDTLYSF